jgi:hypothetical protein
VLVVVAVMRRVAVGPVHVVDVVSVLHGGVTAAVPVLVVMSSVNGVRLAAALIHVSVMGTVQVPVVQVVDVPLVLDRHVAAVRRMHVRVVVVGLVRCGGHARSPRGRNPS